MSLLLTFSSVAPCLYAGDFGEHKKIGDLAFKKFLSKHPDFASMAQQLLGRAPLMHNDPFIPITTEDTHQFYYRSIYDDLLPIGVNDIGLKDSVVLSYGDLTALSGDHSPNFMDLMNRFLNESPSTGAVTLFKNLFTEVEGQYRSELQNLNDGGRGFNPITLEFISLAGTDRSHFHVPATPLRQEFDRFDGDKVDLFRRLLFSDDPLAKTKAQFTLATFDANVTEKYCIMHTLARSYFIQAYQQWKNLPPGGNPILPRNFLIAAIFCNAFGEHYLQDMFAAGHFFADRNASDPLGLQARGVHDYFGRLGVDAKFEGSTIHLLGDGHYTGEQVDCAVDANVASMEDAFSFPSWPLPPGEFYKPFEHFKNLLNYPASDPVTIFPALALVPKNPVGAEFERQQTLGRSISGFTSAFDAIGSKTQFGLGYTAELNVMLVRPTSPEAYEGIFGFGPRAMIEGDLLEPQGASKSFDGRISLGLGVSIYDWVYSNGAFLYDYRDRFSGRFEEGLQIKALSWASGFRVGYVEYLGGIHPENQFSLSFVLF